jgi:hypothetical protein
MPPITKTIRVMLSDHAYICRVARERGMTRQGVIMQMVIMHRENKKALEPTWRGNPVNKQV